MSRCFPFPPPGYEKKARTDDVDTLLIKETQKEKKHKKDKDRKKEGKEKKDKEGSKDKHREKKERKEKHKEKKKDKDKNKTDEKKIDGQSSANNRGKHGETPQHDADIKDAKFALEFSRRIGDEERGRRNQMAEDCTASDQKKIAGMGRMVDKNGESTKQVAAINNAKVQAEFSGRTGDEERGGRNQNFEYFTPTDRRQVDEMGKMAEKKSDNRTEGKVYMDSKGHERKTDKQGIKDERGVGSTIHSSFTGVDQRRVVDVAGLVKDAEKKIEHKDKNKGKEGDDKKKKKHKDRNGEKKSKEKDKHRDKEKKKIEKIKLETMNQDSMRESLNEAITIPSSKPVQIPLNIVKSVGTEENFKKRKECGTNGFLHDIDGRPSKLLKPFIHNHPVNGNGMKLEPRQTPIQCTSTMQGGMQGGVSHLKVDSHEPKINGLVEARPSTIHSRMASYANLQDKNAKAGNEPPHPDSKYLTKILSVPKMEEWSEFDDQEWLFNSNSTEKSNHVSSRVEDTPRVWDKALHMDSADVYALPYVIPY